MINGRTVGYFETRSVFGSPRQDTWSPNFRDDFNTNATERERASAARLVDSLLSTMNEQQRAFVQDALEGVKSNVIILDGLPGTGKTYTLAVLVVCLMGFGKKVVCTSQANAGVHALFDSVQRRISAHPEAANLMDKMVHVYNSSWSRATAILREQTRSMSMIRSISSR